jgi:flagellar motor switch protein FliN/FliY
MKNDAESTGPMDSEAAATAPGPSKPMPLSLDADVFNDVSVAVEARLGRTTMAIRDILALQTGSVVKLDLKMNEPLELWLNDAVVARGEIVAVDDNFGVRVTELAPTK